MKVGVIGAGTMGQGIAKAFAQVEGYEVALCDIKQEWADGGKAKIQKGYARLVEKGKMTQTRVYLCFKYIKPFHHRDRKWSYTSNGWYAFLQPCRPYEINRSYRWCKYTG